MRALVGQGDEVLLPVPYYFNHQMWLDMVGARAVHVPFDGSSGVPKMEAFSHGFLRYQSHRCGNSQQSHRGDISAGALGRSLRAGTCSQYPAGAR